MSEPKDSLYDISDAITLSRRLAGRPAPSAAQDEAPYIRFLAKKHPSAAPSTSTPAPFAETPSTAKPEFGPLPGEPFHNWEEVLKWCVEFSKAECGFIVDSQGFVMMTHGGNLPSDGFEGAGANLGAAFIDLSRTELDSGDIHIADLTYDQRAFLTMRLVDKAGEYCILGILSDKREHVWPKHLVYQQIMKNMSNLLL